MTHEAGQAACQTEEGLGIPRILRSGPLGSGAEGAANEEDDEKTNSRQEICVQHLRLKCYVLVFNGWGCAFLAASPMGC